MKEIKYYLRGYDSPIASAVLEDGAEVYGFGLWIAGGVAVEVEGSKIEVSASRETGEISVSTGLGGDLVLLPQHTNRIVVAATKP